MFGYIYKTTNLINGKIYIGKKISKKFKPNYYGGGKNIRRAIKKYGLENFKVEMIATVLTDNKELSNIEIDLIKVFKSRNKRIGYNITIGGEGRVGMKLSLKQRKLLSEAAIRRNTGNSWGKHSDETKKRISEFNRGKVMSESAKERISIANKGHKRNVGRKQSEDTQIKKVETRTKNGLLKHTEETKKKLSVIAKGRISPNKDKPMTDEQKQKLREYWKNNRACCIYCRYESTTSAIVWKHGSNCKHKK